MVTRNLESGIVKANLEYKVKRVKSLALIIVLTVNLYLLSFTLHPFAFAQQPQAQAGQQIFPVNAKFVQGFGPGYWPTAGPNLTLNLAPGTAFCSNVIHTYAGGTLMLAASATNYVYLNTSNNCAPASNTTGFSATTIPIAMVVTTSTTIASITDVRTMFVSSSGSGSVTSVGMTGDGIIFSPSVSGSPVNSNGTLVPQLLTQTPNTVLAGPGSGLAATPTFRPLAPADLPATISSSTTGNAATATALASTPAQCITNNWATGISTSGNANCLQPGFSNLAGTMTLGQTPLTTAGDILFANSAPALARLPIGGTNQFLGISGGLPAWIQPTFNSLNGTATISQGGTGQTSATAAFNALSPLSTEGDLLYYHTSANARLAKGTNGQCLTSNGTDPVWGSCSTGSGTVSSVGLAMPPMFSVSGSPVTGSGTLTASLVNQNANLIMAGPGSGSAAAPTFRSLVGADLPAPTASTLGGVKSVTCAGGQFLNQISTGGVANCATSSGSSSGLGNGSTVIDASLQAGADFGSKINAAVLACPSSGCVIDARGLSGSQTLAVNAAFGSASQPITLLLASGLTLARASGAQIIMGGDSQIIGQGENASVITGNDNVATITTAGGGSWNPYNYTVEGITVKNAGTGACLAFQGVAYSLFQSNVLDCATGLVISAYYNRILNNAFNGNVNGILWAGIVMDAPDAANSNDIENNTYQGSTGTGVFIRGGYKNNIKGTDDYENLGLGIYNAATGTEIRGPYMENINCSASWAASTQYGLGAVIKDPNSDCEVATTAGTSGSTVSWPSSTHANLGASTTDGSVTWQMYYTGLVAGSEPAYDGCSQAGILIAPATYDAFIDGSTGPSNCILDLDAAVTGDFSNLINTTGNAAWGTGGAGPYSLWVKIFGGLQLGTAGSGFGSLNAKNDYTPGGLSPWYGWQLDGDPGRNCTYYGYCGHLPLHTGLSLPGGIEDHGTVSINPVPNPAPPTLSVVGTPGTTSLSYYVVARCQGGVTLASPAATITNAPNTLSAVNYVSILPPASYGYTDANFGNAASDVYSMCSWDYLKGNTSTSIATNIMYPGFNDQGGSTSPYTAPTRNSTGDEIHNGNVAFTENVGIGTTSPSFPLHVVGSSPVMFDVDGSDQYTSFTVNNTMGRQAAVNFQQNGSQAWALGTDFAGAGTPDFFLYQAVAGRNPLYIDAAGNIRLGGTSGYSGTQAMTILQGGNVGVGTGSPGQKLDVAGGYIRSDTGFCIATNCVTSLWSDPMTTVGDLVYGGTSGAVTRLAGNATTIPMYLKSIGASGAAMAPTLAQIQFGDIAGTVGISAGGTGQTTATGAFNALSPLTTEGDLPYYHAASNARLAVGSSGQCLTSNGTDPLWGSCATSFTGDGTFATNSGSTGTVTLALGNAGANKWWGNNSGSTVAPSYQSIGTQDTSPNWYAAGGGTAQAQTVTLSPAPTALTPGLVVVWKPAAANTAAAPTLSINGLTAKPITKCGTAALLAGDLSTAELEIAVYDGTEFQLLSPVTGLCSTSNTAGGIYYSGGSGAAPKLSAQGNANQILFSGGSGSPTWSDFPDVRTFNAATCNNATAAPLWALPPSAAPTAACRTGTSVQAGALQFAHSNAAQFQVDIPGDYDNSGTVYAKIYLTQAGNTTAGQTIIMNIATGCSSSTDDPSFNTAQAFGTATTTTTANTPFTETLTGVTMTGCTAGGNMNVQISRSSSDTATTSPNVSWVSITFPRRPVNQAN